MALPAHVVAVEPDLVRLGGDTRSLLPALKTSPHGSRLFRDERLRPCLRLDAAANPLLHPELPPLLAWLAESDVVFLERLDQPYGPAELMRALQAEGRVRTGFRSLVPRGPDDWLLIDHPLAGPEGH